MPATQGRYLAFICSCTCALARPLAESGLQSFFKVRPPSASPMILTLERASFIRRHPGIARSNELLIPPGYLPFLWVIQPDKSAVRRRQLPYPMNDRL